MEIEDHPLTGIEASLWNGLLDLAGHPSPFCRHGWLKLIEKANPGWRVRVLIVLDEEGTPCAGLPYVETGGCLVRQSHSLPWGTPAGVAIAPGRCESDDRVAGLLVRGWLDRVEHSFFPCRLAITFPGKDSRALDTLVSHGFKLNEERVFSIRLAGRTFSQWEASLSDSVRNQNRQAIKRGASFHEASSQDEAAGIYRLAVHTARRHGRPGPLLQERFYRLLLDTGGPQAGTGDYARVFLVRVNQRVACYAVCLVHDKKLWLWDYGADRTAFEARPNNLMYLSIIQRSFADGLAEVDLGAVPRGAESLEHFKRSFGASPYERTSAVREPLLFSLAARSRMVFYRFRGV